MDFQLNSLSWLVGLSLLISALTESQFAMRYGSSKQSSPLPRRFELNKIPPKWRPTPVAPPKTETVTRPSSVYHGIAVKCHADSMEVVVRADLFNTGLFLEAQHLHLGSNDCTAFPSAEAELTIHFNLMECGMKLSSTDDSLIYSNLLIYSPEASVDGLLRLEGVTIPVECHYNKRYSVDGSAVHPSWIPFGSAATAEDQMEFKLTLMTDDWKLERGSLTYFLGDPVHVEASVILSDHMPLRIYVEHCVATVTPDADAALRYDFIEHHGCLSDAYLTGSGSRYLPRVQEDKLRFKLDAFMFHQEFSNLIYISCQLKAVPATTAVSTENRACSFIHNRWQSVDGNHKACDSCDVDRQFLAASAEQSPSLSPTRPLEPVVRLPAARQAEEPRTDAKQAPANYFLFRPPSRLRASSPSALMKRANSEWTKTTSSGPLVVLPSIVPTKPAHSAASLRPITSR
ncbi:zona pellucida sperm-binding protein 3-like [Gadus macrocephalus]|uniref:zona pellucida sperm-binding protein 3-like n=1 Tax=Gadus macrocephalus TaxID=80720 RepID=UPI0028CB63D9|nr:zona pellucida sperm-binding protein 3-like [Gadus macrocephalus]